MVRFRTLTRVGQLPRVQNSSGGAAIQTRTVQTCSKNPDYAPVTK